MSSRVPRVLAFALALSATACGTLRGRADAALERGDYQQAVAIYAQLHAKNPNDARVTELLTKAERGVLDQMLARSDAARSTGPETTALRAALDVLQTKDRLSPRSVDPPRAARIDAVLTWAKSAVRAGVRGETSRGRALAARARRTAAGAWLERPELAELGPELDVEIAKAGLATCAKATTTAADQPFALELVAAYCKAVGGAMPAWKPRPLLVGGVGVTGTIQGTPSNEQLDLERSISEALERSVWFTATTDARATSQVQGSVLAMFTRAPAELTRSWAERVPYQATEEYQVPVDVPYVETETYIERVPYTAYEDHYEMCPPPRKGQCKVTRPETRYRDEQRWRDVRKVRTEYRTRTREVTRYRDEPRIFRYQATRLAGRYQATFFIRVDVGSGLRPIEARSSAEDARTAYDHDVEFEPAGVHPEHADLPSALWWRQQQRNRVRDTLLASLDQSWTQRFCNEGVSSIEEAARCARVRPKPAPAAVRAHIAALIGDDPDAILALPRPGELAH